MYEFNQKNFVKEKFDNCICQCGCKLEFDVVNEYIYCPMCRMDEYAKYYNSMKEQLKNEMKEAQKA